MKIEIYLKSIPPAVGIGPRAFTCVASFSPDRMQRVSKQFNGKYLDGQSVALLHELECLPGELGEIKIFDVSDGWGWLKARLAGAKELPAIVLDGETHQGFKPAKQALAHLHE
jgi:hypothetical protein